MIRLLRFLPAALLVGALLHPAAATAQPAEGIPVTLPDGRLAILGADGPRVVVLRIAGSRRGSSPIDLQEGDVVASFQGIPDPDAATFRRIFAEAEPGGTLRLGVRRGGSEHTVELPRPGSTFRVPEGALAPPGGGWVTATEPAASVPSFATPAIGVERLLVDVVPADAPGMSVAVLRGGKVDVALARGLASLELDAPLSSRSVMPVDSVTKQFTAFAIALLASRDRLALDDDVRRYLPEVPDLGSTITLRHLLTHTSGLKDYTGLLALTGWRFGDGLTADELITLVHRQRELDFRPGTEHRYSNTNYALLPVVVERITGVAFGEWMQQELFGPLRMEATSFPATPGAVLPRDVNLYRPVEGGFERETGGHELAGAGGLMSTSVDLMRWARELIAGELGGPAVQEMMRQKTVLEDGTEIDYALGLGIGEFRGVRRLSHSGSGPGSASVLHVYPGDDLAIAVLSNRGEAQVFDLAERIAELYLGDRLEDAGDGPSGLPPGAFMITEEDFRGEGAPAGVPLDPNDAAAFAGRYVMDEDDRELFLEADGAELSLKLDPQIPGVPLVHLGDGRFRFPPAGWEVSFDRSARPAPRIILHLIPGSVHRGADRDVTGHRAEVSAPSAAELRTYAGDYLSSELGVAYRIVEDDGALFLEHPRLGRQPLDHLSGAAFGLPGRRVHRITFLRADEADPASAVTGLEAQAYAWSVSVRFDRLGGS